MRTTTWMFAALVFALNAHSQAVSPDVAAAALNIVLPPAVETTLALSAAPAHLRDGATVYVYGSRGYEKARSGTNGFTCLVNREGFLLGMKIFSPTCWDKPGEETYLPVMLRVGELLSRKATVDAVTRDIDAGFASGKYHAPKTGGIAYMLAGAIELDPVTGQVVKQVVPGHYMFYSVGVTNAQLGFAPEAAKADPTLPFTVFGGAGGNHGLGYVIAIPGDAHAMHGASK